MPFVLRPLRNAHGGANVLRLSLIASAALALPALAQEAADTQLQQITIKGHYDNAIGTSDAASQGQISSELLKNRPALRPGEVLEFVPGVIVTQHSGDGKANQFFLRGFNLDHGTDFATSVNGMPVNMPTHGHGQGYTDLNFMIPELIDHIDYRKGPYFANAGDFALAGAADLVYRRSLAQPFGQITLGENGYRRGVVAGSRALNDDGLTLLGAIEVMHNDGPWVNPEHLQKVSLLGTLSSGSQARGWSVSAMGYHASWNASDQVPERAVISGAVDRFGAIDPTDGGRTSRYSVSGEWRDRGETSGVKLTGFLMQYDLNLFSNLTYALRDPVNGDQIEQSDKRTTLGLTGAKDWTHNWLGRDARLEAGVQLRHDRIQVGLFDTQARARSGTVREDHVRETALGAYVEDSLPWTDWLRTTVGVRADRYHFNVEDQQTAANSGSVTATKVSPKFSAVFGPWAKTELFVNAGRGFHSNDGRGTTATVDARTGDAITPVPPLVSGKGYELGLRTEAISNLQSSIALWRLESDSELIYVGDSGTTEEGLPSKRTGIEWNNRWTPLSWFLVDADFAWTRARFANGTRIPGAVERVASVAGTLRDLGPWSASLQWRYLGPRPLTEDNEQRAPSTLVTNLRVGYKLTSNIDLTMDVFNLTDRKVNDIEYYYESRLSTAEPAEGVFDRHFHPAEPRSVRLTLQARF